MSSLEFHFREAERLLARAYSPGSGRWDNHLLAAAQVHATLADASAAALGIVVNARLAGQDRTWSR